MESNLNTVTRRGRFDAGHRVMHERFKCFNIHGHNYDYELTFSYETPEKLGYAIDFKEIKRVACEWIDERMDHGFFANPVDLVMVEAATQLKSKLYIMHLVDADGFCNPSAENICKELFFAVERLLNRGDLRLAKVKLWETPNCVVECIGLSSSDRIRLYHSALKRDCDEYRNSKGVVEYDDRKVTV